MDIDKNLSPLARPGRSFNPLRTVLIGTSLGVESVASTVARKAPCSVLVIPAEAALEEGIADAIESQAMPCWHQDPVAAGA